MLRPGSNWHESMHEPPEYPLCVPAMLTDQVRQHGAAEAIKGFGRSLSYRDVDRKSAQLALGLLAAGAGKGTRIGILMPNSPEWAVAWFAAHRVGALVVGLSTFYKPPELARVLRHADVDTLLIADRYLNHDYCEGLEQAFGGLAGVSGTDDLYLAEAPFLRRIYVWRDPAPRWARGTLASLIQLGDDAVPPGLLAAVEENVTPADQAIVIYTSGSTSEPKGVVHTHGTVVRHSHLMSQYSTILAGDRICASQPFFWVGGMLTLLGAFHKGATVLCPEHPGGDHLLELLRTEKATHLSGQAPQLLALTDHPDFSDDDLRRLKPTSVTQRWVLEADQKLPRDRFPNSLGMTETFGPHSGERRDVVLPAERAGSFGRALAGVERKIVDQHTGKALPNGQRGELCVRGHTVMEGFYKMERSDSLDAEGFYHTGDECSLLEDGHLFFHGRLNEMIKTSGANVAPSEVEDVLCSYPEVVDAAVVGLPHAQLGQMVVAAVVLQHGTVADEAMLRERLRGELSSYKVPRRIAFFDFDELPRTPSNKIRKHELRALLAGSVG